MTFKRKRINLFLLLLAVVLGGAAAAIMWLPPLVSESTVTERKLGVFENREICVITDAKGGVSYIVRDSAENYLFTIPLKDCLIDSRFRDGKLRFRLKSNHRQGYIDASGFVCLDGQTPGDAIQVSVSPDTSPQPHEDTSRPLGDIMTTRIPEVDLRTMITNHPFSKEASKILSGRLPEPDSLNRRQILNYCEHFRMAYNTRDIDFLRQVFSDDALIVVGHTVRSQKSKPGVAGNERVRLTVRSKQQYLVQLSRIFNINKKIDVNFSDFRIMRHPTIDGIYGVTLRQRYNSDRYSDDGFLFLLWDFRNPSMPEIHVRTWQSAETIRQGDEQIGMQDFNFE